MASDGHIACCEEDRFGKAIVDVMLSINRAAKPFLKPGNRVIVEASRDDDKVIEEGIQRAYAGQVSNLETASIRPLTIPAAIINHPRSGR